MELINQIDETICFNDRNIRVIGSYDEPWFVAKDICEILDIKDNRSALRIIPDKWKGEQILPTTGGRQNMSIINEAGLYKLIMRSNKTIAQKFQEVVCEDILPSLRKKGEYKIQSIIDKNKKLEEEKKKVEEDKEEVEEDKEEVEEDKEEVEEDKEDKLDRYNPIITCGCGLKLKLANSKRKSHLNSKAHQKPIKEENNL